MLANSEALLGIYQSPHPTYTTVCPAKLLVRYRKRNTVVSQVGTLGKRSEERISFIIHFLRLE